MIEETEKNKSEEQESLTCPECGKAFQDMRGLTSHARHVHNLGKEEITSEINEDDGSGWKILGGIGVALITLITLGRG